MLQLLKLYFTSKLETTKKLYTFGNFLEEMNLLKES
jgi:hypothetical protein